MTKAEALVTNYNKKELADKVVELSDKLEEMKQVEAQVSASVETLKEGDSALGVVNENGTYKLVRLVFDLKKNAAAIVGKEDLAQDHQIAAGKLVREVGPLFYKAAGLKT